MEFIQLKKQGDLVFLAVDEELASILFAIMGRIGGDPDKCKRKRCDHLYFALEKAGVPYSEAPMVGQIDFAYAGFSSRIE